MIFPFYVFAMRRSPIQATSRNILEAFNQLPEIEKHTIATEIIKQVALLDISPLTDKALTEIAEAILIQKDSASLEAVP